MTTPNTSSFSMKRFMSHRRIGSDDMPLPPADDLDMSPDRNLSKQKPLPRAKPWLHAAVRRREPPTPVMIRRGQDIHKISTPLPQLPGELPHSSTSSLCSCDVFDHIQPEARSFSSSKAAATLGLPDLPTPSRSPSMLPPPRSMRGRENLLSPAWDTVEHDTRSERNTQPRPSITFSDSGVDPLDASKGRTRKSEDHGGEYSEDTQNFNREIDMAFQDPISDRTDHKLDFHIPEEPSTPPLQPRSTRSSNERRRSISSLKDFSFDSSDGKKSEEKEQEKTPAPDAAPAPATKPIERPALRPKGRKPSKGVAGIHRPSRAQGGSIWNIPENVTERLTGRFKKIEADEVLTPARIEELTKARAENMRKAAARPARGSTESTDSKKDKPLPPEPSSAKSGVFKTHSRVGSKSSDGSRRVSSNASSSLVTRGNRSASNTSDISSVAEINIRKSSGAKSAVAAARAKSVAAAIDSSEGADADDEADIQETENDEVPALDVSRRGSRRSSSFLPPPKNPARFRSGAPPPNQRLPDLPNRRSHHKRQSIQGGRRVEENEDYLFLVGTPYTLTKPAFRHGPITLSKADMKKVVMTMDDTLDWTAFQMAILGGAGELFPDESAEEDARAVNDLGDWFDSFGFESLGGLVVAEAPSSRSSSRSTISTIRSLDQELPIPISTELPSGLEDASAFDSTKFFRGSVGGPKPWMAEGDMPMRSKAETPPRTPMHPQVISADDGHMADVSMGYNLNHDLDDFLRWDVAHMAGAGF